MLEKLLFAAMIAAAAAFGSATFAADGAEASRETALRLMNDGNYREAETMFRALALDPNAPAKEAAENLRDAVDCLVGHLGRAEDAEKLLDEAAAAHPDSWRVLAASAAMTNGNAARPAPYRKGGRLPPRRPQFEEYFRVRAIRLLLQAETRLDDARDPAAPEEKLAFYRQFEQAVRLGRMHGHAWRLTALTDLAVTPEPEDMNVYWSRPTRGAPVDENGDPVYYRAPASWDAAKNDGERWRWLLGRMETLGGEGKATADWLFGEFLTMQFGVQTMVEAPAARDAELAGEDGPFAVRTLGDDETIARLGGGLKRFAMPDEFNHIKTLRRVADSDVPALRGKALSLLANVFENRQQFAKAVAAWRELTRVKDAGEGILKTAAAALERITANSGLLERADSAPAGKRTVLSYLFRNGPRVDFTAKRLDEKQLLADIRDKLKSGDKEFAENYMYRRPETLARFVFEKAGEGYVRETAAEWSLDLRPLPDHYSRRVDVEIPLETAGCYLIEAAMRDGNTSRLVMWIADTALLRKDAFGNQMFFVADAASGQPVADAAVSFLGFARKYDDAAGKSRLVVKEFAEKTDADGLFFVPSEKMNQTEWLITATTADGRFAYLGFDSVWMIQPETDADTAARAFLITDRPVYRPGQEVHFKAWLGKPAYTPRPGDSFANRQVKLIINNPRGETVYEKTLTTDAYGGVADSFTTEEGATLGHYYVSLQSGDTGGGVGFLVEEYKKPEYEVSLDAPDRALELGDSVQLKVKAAYYFGAPVSDAKVTYKILRTPHSRAWIPPWRWDWLYGSGAWAVTYDYSWYPGWSEWLHPGPSMPWMPFRPMQPELVAEGEGELDADGVFRFTLDTAPAKQLFGHQDHEYQISFEVTDASRRTIAGSGKVVATRKPFSVALWTDRGYYRSGDEIRAEVKAMLPLSGGVAASGKATLYRISYADPATPKETEAGSWDVTTTADGTASVRMRADAAGQYKLAVSLRDGDGKTVEGATLLTVRGAAEEGDFRFSALELVPDKREYAPGETLRLAVNSRNSDAFVLLLPRAERAGSASGKAAAQPVRPQLIRLKNGSHALDLEIGRADQPNFFCEAITVFNGKAYSETREIFVPPADKTLRVEVVADKDSYLPGEKAAFSIRVADANGDPVVGQCVVSLYDKSVEYISGGSNVGDIRAAFWSWKRFHHVNMTTSLDKYSYPIERKGDKPWQPIGIFGGQEADWNDDAVYTNGKIYGAPRPRAMARSSDMVMMDAVAMPAAGAPPPMMANAKVESAMAFAPEAPAPAQDAAMSAGGGAAMAEPSVRSEFADTAFWTAALETDDDGKASFTVAMPENLTGWKARAWVMGMETRVGDGENEVATRKNVIVRPQAPRFLTQKDQVILSANLHNYLPRAKQARAVLVLDGGLLEAAEGVELTKAVELTANGEARVDWLVDARRPGTATVVMKLLTDEESDAAEITIPVVIHGARRVESFGAVVRPDENDHVIRFTVPAERLADRSRLQFSFSPSIAVSLLEALPYLIEYPYGCTEQTLNRFLPVATTRKYLDTLGVSLADAKKMLDRAEADDAQSAAWRKKWGDDRAALKKLPVFDDAELDAMIKQGIERLAGMQNADGGWGWFSGASERSWPHTTGVVVYGLAAAADAGAALPAGMFDTGVEWLARYQAEQIARLEAPEKKDGENDDDAIVRKEKADNLDAFVHLILSGTPKADAKMRDFLYRDRLELSLTGLSMLGLALEREGRAEELAMVLRNLSQFVETNSANRTAWLRTPNKGWWWWHNDAIETQTWYLKLLAKTEPQSDLASGVAKYLLQNRKNGVYWRSTRDTAYAIEALTQYAAASGEIDPDMTVKLYLDGKVVRERRLTRANILEDNRFSLDGVAVETGDHELRIERTGKGSVYCNGSLSVFSLEDPIAAAGGDLKVSRAFYKLTPSDKAVDMQSATGGAVRGAVEKYARTEIPGPFATGASAVPVASGDLIEVELTVTSANDYEYLVFEDMKAAGLEAVELRSGYNGNAMGAYVEYRDQKVALFVRYLPKGEHTIAYRFRAETPGAFSALPAFGGGMYATELFCNSNEMKIRVVEPGTFE